MVNKILVFLDDVTEKAHFYRSYCTYNYIEDNYIYFDWVCKTYFSRPGENMLRQGSSTNCITHNVRHFSEIEQLKYLNPQDIVDVKQHVSSAVIILLGLPQLQHLPASFIHSRHEKMTIAIAYWKTRQVWITDRCSSTYNRLHFSSPSSLVVVIHITRRNVLLR